MKTVFVSMPMRGKERSDITTEQEKILALTGEYLDEDVRLVESFLNQELSPLECLGESIKRMSTADYVVFAEGYENARGCRIEFECASEYSKRILQEHGNKIQEVV